MRNRPIYKIGAIVLSIVLIACGSGSTTDDADKINVLATTPMLGDFVNQIGGENINLTILMPPEADPHTYDPSPQDATKIADADIVFYVGLKYEPSALIKLVENTSNTDSVLVEVGEAVNPIEFSEEGHDDHDEEGHDDHDEHSEIIVPQSTPETLQIIKHELSEKVELHFTTEVATEIHIHGYDIDFMVYPDQENILTIELSIAGEFEIEDHDSGVEFARLVVSP